MPDGILSYLSFPTALIGNPGSLSLVVVAAPAHGAFFITPPLRGSRRAKGTSPQASRWGGIRHAPSHDPGST